MSLGASWDEKRGQWMFLLTARGTPAVPYTKEHYQTFRQELLQEAHEREAAVYYLLHEFLSFCEAVPPKSFNGWFWKLDYLFDQVAKKG
jgi:hypothetical protein